MHLDHFYSYGLELRLEYETTLQKHPVDGLDMSAEISADLDFLSSAKAFADSLEDLIEETVAISDALHMGWGFSEESSVPIPPAEEQSGIHSPNMRAQAPELEDRNRFSQADNERQALTQEGKVLRKHTLEGKQYQLAEVSDMPVPNHIPQQDSEEMNKESSHSPSTSPAFRLKSLADLSKANFVSREDQTTSVMDNSTLEVKQRGQDIAHTSGNSPASSLHQMKESKTDDRISRIENDAIEKISSPPVSTIKGLKEYAALIQHHGSKDFLEEQGGEVDQHTVFPTTANGNIHQQSPSSQQIEGIEYHHEKGEQREFGTQETIWKERLANLVSSDTEEQDIESLIDSLTQHLYREYKRFYGP